MQILMQPVKNFALATAIFRVKMALMQKNWHRLNPNAGHSCMDGITALCKCNELVIGVSPALASTWVLTVTHTWGVCACRRHVGHAVHHHHTFAAHPNALQRNADFRLHDATKLAWRGDAEDMGGWMRDEGGAVGD